jgi:hypothetical protein
MEIEPKQAIMKKFIFTAMFLLAMSLAFISCNKEEACEGTLTKDFSVTDFTRIKAGGNLRAKIQKGNTFGISAAGCSRDINDLRMSVSNNKELEIDFSRNLNKRSAVDINITMPSLVAANLSGAATANINGFQEGTTLMRMVLSGAAKAIVTGTTAQTQFDLSGASILTLSGTTNLLKGNLSGASELRAFDTPA